MAESRLVWETLATGGVDVVPKARIAELARRIDLNPDATIRTLSENRRLLPLFKGFYYLCKPEEILLHKGFNPLNLFARGAKAKDIGTWYFGLHTALRLHGMGHEYRLDEHVISDAFYRPNGVPIAGRRFIIHKWRAEMGRFGVVRKGEYFVSDPEKTVLDFAYLDYYAMAKGRAPSGTWREHLESVRVDTLRSYLPNYPEAVRGMVEAAL